MIPYLESSYKAKEGATACTFSKILGACDPKRMYGCICNKHLQKIFGLSNSVVKYKTEKETFPCTQTRFTRIRKPYIPFPFQFAFDEATGQIDLEVEPCLKMDMYAEKWRAFAEFACHLDCFTAGQQSEAKKTPKDSPVYLATLLRAISGFTPFIQDTTCVLQYTVFFDLFKHDKNYKALLESRWAKSEIAVYYTNNQNEFVYDFFPMTKMPILYQMIFFHTEMSNHERANHDPRSISLAPLLALNADNFEFCVINNSEENPIYVVDEDVQEGSAVVIAGVTRWKNSFDLWRRYPAAVDMYDRGELMRLPVSC